MLKLMSFGCPVCFGVQSVVYGVWCISCETSISEGMWVRCFVYDVCISLIVEDDLISI